MNISTLPSELLENIDSFIDKGKEKTEFRVLNKKIGGIFNEIAEREMRQKFQTQFPEEYDSIKEMQKNVIYLMFKSLKISHSHQTSVRRLNEVQNSLRNIGIDLQNEKKFLLLNIVISIIGIFVKIPKIISGFKL